MRSFAAMEMNVSGKTAIVTGGSGVLGGAMAEDLAQAGCQVVIIGRNPEKVNKQVETLTKYSDDILGIPCDVMSEDALQDAAAQVMERFGSIDILINGAGGNVPSATQQIDQTIFDVPLTGIKDAVDLNLMGTVYPSLVFGKYMAEQGSGSIINISSMASFQAITRVMGYSIAKAAVDNFTRWMATEMALKFGDKVRVNAISPGFFIADQNRRLLINEDGSLTDRGQKIIDQTPFRRFGEIHELSGAVQFLCSEASSFITGVVLPVDGGFSSFSGI